MKTLIRVLVIEDKEDLADDACREIKDVFEEHDSIDVEVVSETDFDKGLARVRAGESDVVVLDVQRDAAATVSENRTAGHDVYLEIKKAKFSPVVFWTAHPGKVNHEVLPPLVTVVAKDDIAKLPDAIEAAVAGGAVGTIKGIEEHVANVLREHMWTELAPNWDEYSERAGYPDIAQVLISRLARVFEDDQEHSVSSHPSHRYVYPPASTLNAPGDVLHSADGSWWVALTPACDFAQEKVGFVLLARASPLKDHRKYSAWQEEYKAQSNKAEKNRGKATWDILNRDVLASTRGRFHFLPKFREIPDLVIDLEDVRSEAVDKFVGYEHIASLASPFAETLLVQHSHFRGRIGAPDIDMVSVKERLLREGESSSPLVQNPV